ncbi:MAG: MFS transporter, partial [Acidimicrobiia bacterium]
MTLAQSLPVGEHPDPDAQRGGIGADRRYFLLLLVQVGVVGLTVGIERVVVPLLGRDAFGLDRRSAILSFIVAFGLAKAPLNLVAGAAAARIGGRRVLLIGWLSALPVPFLLALAPSWSWVIAANVFLGVQQGLCWSATIIMKVDLARPSERGFAIGLNELVGYAATAAAAYGGAVIAATYGLRTAPFVVLGALVLAGAALAALTPERSRAPKVTDVRS